MLAVPQEVVRRKLAMWQQHGVVREEAGGRYTVQETAPAAGREKHERSVLLLDSDEEGDSNTATQSEQREEKLRVNMFLKMCTDIIYTHTLTHIRGIVFCPALIHSFSHSQTIIQV